MGRVAAGVVGSVSIEDIRQGGPGRVEEILSGASGGQMGQRAATKEFRVVRVRKQGEDTHRCHSTGLKAASKRDVPQAISITPSPCFSVRLMVNSSVESAASWNCWTTHTAARTPTWALCCTTSPSASHGGAWSS